MKRIIITSIFGILSLSAYSQPLEGLNKEMMVELERSIILLVFLFMISSLILSLMRMILDNRLKNKMIEKGVPVEVIANMLPKKSELTSTAKYFCILTAICVGLLLISFFPPLGLHSAAIMGFCIATGLLGYYFWSQKISK
ncbi:hypothetical protein DVR12_24570 [Chitinophaga silvatica]|uniref:Uncharacterized protein n=1 Tax=Chitinophaga silvatica TaxID=2282649 RepID=A0A3E1Y3A3_9BACT|nr:hypothetical protein [Chitinophaga silvatica]RFS19151.1 hypothetical protein DVR12_24570 [Chitinophaga silvatica]